MLGIKFGVFDATETGKWLLIIVSIFALLVYVPKMNQGYVENISKAGNKSAASSAAPKRSTPARAARADTRDKSPAPAAKRSSSKSRTKSPAPRSKSPAAVGSVFSPEGRRSTRKNKGVR